MEQSEKLVIENTSCPNCSVKWIKDEEIEKMCFCCGYPKETMRKFKENNVYWDEFSTRWEPFLTDAYNKNE